MYIGGANFQFLISKLPNVHSLINDDMLRIFKGTIIGLLISITLFNTTAFAYDDVSSSESYYYSVEYLRRNDVFPETKLFKPETIVSRAEFVKYLVLLNSPEFKVGKSVKLPFEDTRDNAWYAPYLQEAIKLGILDENDKKVYPYNKLTVLEAIELLFHSKSIPIPKKHIGPISYKDVKNNKQSQALVMRAMYLGVIQPERSDYFGIYKRVTRSMAADMIFNMDMVNLRAPQSSTPSVGSLDSDLQKIINTWQIIRVISN